MMLFTHMLAGMAAGALLGSLTGFTGIAVVLGGIGGAAPDLDMLAVHRRSLHAPILYGASASILVALSVVRPGAATVAVAAGVTGAALHSMMDVLGGGKELRPWERTDDRAVYCHVTGTWWRAQRVAYDGSLADLGVAAALAMVVAATAGGTGQLAAGTLLTAAAGYVAVRRRIADRIPRRYDTYDAFIKAKIGI